MDATDRIILTIEADNPAPRGPARRAAQDALGLTPTRWNQRLLRLLDDREALEADPLTVYRLRRVIERACGRC